MLKKCKEIDTSRCCQLSPAAACSSQPENKRILCKILRKLEKKYENIETRC